MKVVVQSSSLWFLVASIVFGLPVSRVRRATAIAEDGQSPRIGPAKALNGIGAQPKPNLTRYRKPA